MCDFRYNECNSNLGLGMQPKGKQQYKIDPDCWLPEIKNNSSSNRKHNIEEIFKELATIRLEIHNMYTTILFHASHKK